MKRPFALLTRPLTRIIGLFLLIALAATLIVLGNLSRWTAHSGAQPIAASQAAAMIKSGQARAIDVAADRVYLTTDAGEFVFTKDRQASVPQMLETPGDR